jgi:hypothetical protein
MPSIREQIENVIESKFDPNGDGSHLVGNGLLQYMVNDYELSVIQQILINDDSKFTEEFYNIVSNEYIVWDYDSKIFRNKLTGDQYFIRLFYDQFDDLVQSALDWGFQNSVTSVNDWAFGTDGIDLNRTNGMYISNNGGTNNQYTVNDTGISHATTSVSVPSGNAVRVKVRLKSNGEVGYDDVRIYVRNVPITPSPDVNQGLTGLQTAVVGEVVFQDYVFDFPASFTGTDIYLSFQWRNDNSIGGQPPAHISSVEILYN